MNKWEALTKIVISFIEAKKPWHALCAIFLLVLPLGLTAVAALLLK